MQFRTLASMLALAGAAVSAPAFAQDGDSRYDRDSHFDGPYVSATIGMAAQGNDGRADRLLFDKNGDGGFNDTIVTTTGANAFSPGFCGGVARTGTAAGGCSRDQDKLEYAVRAGYDRLMGNLVVGGLIEGSRAESTDGTAGFSTTPASYSFVRQLDYAVSARLRAGYTPGGGALFYVTGGGSYAKIDHGFSTTNAANAFTERRDGKMVWGWQAGGGGEIMVTDNISLGMEYLYNRYKDNKYQVLVTQGSAPATNPFILSGSTTAIRPSDRDFDFHALRATVGFHF